MQSESQDPVREEISQDALCYWTTGCKMWKKGNDGVWGSVLASPSGRCQQLNVGV